MRSMAAKNAKTETEKQQKVLERVQHLVQLAVQNTEEQEARSAAMQAAQLMTEHDLVCVPRSQLEAAQKVVSGAQQLVKKAKQEKWTNMGIGLILGQVLLGKGGLKL